MAQITRVRLVDDLDGGEAVETVPFALDGTTFEIDLNETNAAGLRDVLAPYVAAARRAGRAPVAARTKGEARGGRPRDESAAIREWANANGHPVSARGRIPSAVVTAYENRGSAPTAEPAAAPAAAVPAAAPTSKVEAVFVEADVKPTRRSRKKVDA